MYTHDNVGIGERMSGKEFGENWKFKMTAPFFLLITTVATKYVLCFQSPKDLLEELKLVS